MPMKYFESRTYGEVLSRITNDVDTLGQSLNQSVTQIITSVATLVGTLVMMISISGIMTLISLVILPVSAILISFIIKHSQKYFRQQQEYLDISTDRWKRSMADIWWCRHIISRRAPSKNLKIPIRFCFNRHGSPSFYPD